MGGLYICERKERRERRKENKKTNNPVGKAFSIQGAPQLNKQIHWKGIKGKFIILHSRDNLTAIMETVQGQWLLNYRSWESPASLNSCKTPVPSSALEPWAVWCLPELAAKDPHCWWLQTAAQTALSLPVIRQFDMQSKHLAFLQHFSFFRLGVSFSFWQLMKDRRERHLQGSGDSSWQHPV